MKYYSIPEKMAQEQIVNIGKQTSENKQPCKNMAKLLEKKSVKKSVSFANIWKQLQNEARGYASLLQFRLQRGIYS